MKIAVLKILESFHGSQVIDWLNRSSQLVNYQSCNLQIPELAFLRHAMR